MKTEVKAPTKLCDAIDLALKDLELVEKDPNYSVYMYRWHQPSDDLTVCNVCFAGSIMAKTLDVDRRFTVHYPDYYNREWYRVFSALNEVRMGYIGTALEGMGYEDSQVRKYPFFKDITAYENNPTAFKDQMKKISEELRVLGL